MSGKAKLALFIVAVLTMACFAIASVMMAQNRPALAAILFVLAFIMTGMGFATRARFMNRP